MKHLYIIDFFSTSENLSSQVSYRCCHVWRSFKCSAFWWLLKIHYPKISVMRGIEHTLSSFFNDVLKTTVVNQIITSHKAIYNLFCYGIYYKPHSIFKSKPYEFHNRNIELFSGNDTRMADYFIGVHIDLRMRKSLIATVSSVVFNTMALNSKLSKVV